MLGENTGKGDYDWFLDPQTRQPNPISLLDNGQLKIRNEAPQIKAICGWHWKEILPKAVIDQASEVIRTEKR